MRLIDADKFEEYLKGLHDKYTEDIEECKREGRTSGASYLNTHKELLINIMLRLKQQPAVNEWIPCSEEFPLKEGELISDDVLVYLESGYQVVGKYRKNGDWFDNYNNWIGDNVIAWMPLPEPYKGENNANN